MEILTIILNSDKAEDEEHIDNTSSILPSTDFLREHLFDDVFAREKNGPHVDRHRLVPDVIWSLMDSPRLVLRLN